MPRYPSRYASQPSSFSFGPGPISTALKTIIGVNVATFVVTTFVPQLRITLGLVPMWVLHDLRVWTLLTYMFVHADTLHILFNMLTLWFFGAELERLWGPRAFAKFYLLVGIGAGILTTLVSLVSYGPLAQLNGADIIGASGAVFGVLLAYAMYFPNRLVLFLVFPIRAKIVVIIMGSIAFLSSFSANGGGIASATHLGGLLVAYVYLKGLRVRLSPWAEVKYRYVKWKIGRARKKFDVYSGGRAGDDKDRWDRRVH
jgi:membrane associated rhomboid family serine protease